MTFRAYIVEDSSTIRDNLTETLKELARFEPVGTTESEHEARRWLAANAGTSPSSTCSCAKAAA